MDPIILTLLALPPLIVAWFFWTEFKGAGWQPAPRKAIESAFRLVRLNKDDVLYDLGAGDGRVIIAAAKAGAKAVGIEIDPLRWLICKLRLKINRLEGKARAVCGDIYNVPLDPATVVFVYLRDWSTERLKDKFMTELRKGTRIIAYHWPLESWKPVAHDKENDVYVYKI
jgi:ribosomal protein L11 methylase PrmA